ncbi:MAG: DNA primase [Pseudomonadota bacterium]
MSRIPQSFIDEVIARTDVVDVINSRVPLKKAGREFKACCPFHDEKTPSFTVVPAKQFYHCFGCGESGSAIGFLMAYERLTFVEAIEELAGALGMEVPKDASGPQPSQDLYGIMAQADEFYRAQLKHHEPAVAYLKKRGVSGEVARDYAIGYAPDGWDPVIKALPQVSDQKLQAAGLTKTRDDGSGHYDRFRDRIMFPIRDHRGRVVAFGGRAMADGGPKYLNSPETDIFHKGRELYGLYEARQSRADLSQLLVVEGYMDVVSLAQFGVRNAVATLGTATTADHLKRLFRIASDVVFCFDGDRAGRKAAWRALNVSLGEVRDGRQIRFLFLPDGEDPDTLIRSEGADGFNERLAAATPLSTFLMDHLADGVDMDSLDGLARFAEQARPLVARIPPGVYREMLSEAIAKRCGLSRAQFDAHVPAPRRERPAGARPVPPAAPRSPWIASAINLLLNFPKIAEKAQIPEELRSADLVGTDILIELLEQLAAAPHLTTAAVLERWREHAAAPHFRALLDKPVLINADQAVEELQGLLGRLQKEVRQRRYDHLLEKSRNQTLTETEKADLRELLSILKGGS